MHAYRSHTCGALRSTDAGSAVRLSGWVHRKRDHGGLMFIDLRDNYGLTQLVLSPETPGFALAERARAESVFRIDGEVLKRSPDTINPNLPTGEVEIRVRDLEVLSEAAELPVPVFGEPDYPEDLRLKYRYLDLRRDTLHRNIKLEMSFVTQEDVFSTIEPVIRGVFEEFKGERTISADAFPRIPFRESVQKYGSDKPDLRNPIEMQDVSEHFRGGGFGVFAGILDASPKHRVWAIPAPGGGSRAFCDRMDSWAKGEGQKGLAYIFWREGEEGGAGPVAKNLGAERTEAMRAQLGLKAGDAVFFAAGDPDAFYKFAGLARTRVGTELGLVKEGEFRFCWIVDFPMFEWNEEEKRVDFSHNPFSMPQGELEALTTKDPLEILAYQYDIVCNGVELSSGAIRNHRPDIMLKAFEIAGYGPEVVEDKFGGMLNAFRYGAPPHGGIAPGIDRIVMLLAGAENIREVIAFPLNQQARDLMMNAPSPVADKQLKELSIRLAPSVKA